MFGRTVLHTSLGQLWWGRPFPPQKKCGGRGPPIPPDRYTHVYLTKCVNFTDNI